MRTIFDREDIELIVEAVAKRLQPSLLAGTPDKNSSELLDVTSLSTFLNVDVSWVYKQVSLRAIPFFKLGKYTRFRRAEIEKWLSRQACPPLAPFKSFKRKAGD